MRFFRHLLRSAALVAVCFASTVQAMKEGQPGPFSLGVTVSLNGQDFRADPARFPAHNTMTSQGVYGTLCHLAQGQLQAALNTGWADKIFTMDFCKEIFNPHLEQFSQFIFSDLPSHFSGEYLGENYVYSEDFYTVHVLEKSDDPKSVKLLLGCQKTTY